MLTEDMTRLCGDIVSMRKMRGDLMSQLQGETDGRRRLVTNLVAQFADSRAEMAKRTGNERMAFLNQLKRTVGAHQRDLRNDLAGARRAWAGKGS